MSAERPLDRRDLLHDLQAGETQCTARSKRTGKRCRAPSMLGGNVCRAHGGAAPQTRAKAQRRLEQAADVLVQRLLGLALDGDAPDAVALQAIRDALDRAGLGAKQALELSAEREPAPWEQMFSGIAKITRAQHEAKMAALRNGDARAARELNVVDAEVVPPQETHDYRPSGSVEAVARLSRADALGNESATSTARRSPLPVAVTYEEAPAIWRGSQAGTRPARPKRRKHRR